MWPRGERCKVFRVFLVMPMTNGQLECENELRIAAPRNGKELKNDCQREKKHNQRARGGDTRELVSSASLTTGWN